MALTKLKNNALTSISQLPSGLGSDPNVKVDLARLGLRVFANQNLVATNSNSLSYDVFQDDSGIGTETNTDRDSGEFVSTKALSVTDTVITLDGSNYTTYFDVTDNDFMSVMKHTSGLATTGANSRYDTTSTNNLAFHSSSSYQSSQTVANSHEPTLASYIWGSPSSQTAYTFNNSDSTASYRFVIFNFAFKSGVTFSPTHNANAGFRWRNGGGSFGDFTLFYNTTTNGTASQIATHSSGVTNGNSYTMALTNSSGAFYSGITTRVYHSADNHFMFDTLTIPGTVRASALTTSATGNFTSNTITAGSSTTKISAVINYSNEAGTNALNSDIVLQVSADNGSNYSTATLTALPDFATGVKSAKVTDVSVTAGTQIKYKISFANQSGSKEARIKGVSLQF